ncbi:phosphoglycerate kinase [bacterium]|nr:MAG: phosphoglycerate kinase [bacterium]
MLKTIKEADLENKTVLLRADLDDSDTSDKDNFRLEVLVPTIDYLLENNCKIIIIGHRGRPNGILDSRLSLLPVFENLKIILKDSKVSSLCFVPDVINGDNEIIKNLAVCDVIMLENLRFYAGEESNDEQFAKKLAGLADVFVNDAFAAYRKHASIVGIPKFLPSYMGLRMAEEIKVLSEAMKNPKRPAVAIIGGAKVETKAPCIDNLSKIYDHVLIGGRIGLVSVADEKPFMIEDRKINNVIFPVDYIGDRQYDIGKNTIEKYKEIISKAKTIIWNGPMGKFEDDDFMNGTKEIAEAVIASGAHTVIGGGDTIAALNKLKIPLDKFNWVSVGGGAMLNQLSQPEADHPLG